MIKLHLLSELCKISEVKVGHYNQGFISSQEWDSWTTATPTPTTEARSTPRTLCGRWRATATRRWAPTWCKTREATSTTPWFTEATAFPATTTTRTTLRPLTRDREWWRTTQAPAGTTWPTGIPTLPCRSRGSGQIIWVRRSLSCFVAEGDPYLALLVDRGWHRIVLY